MRISQDSGANSSIYALAVDEYHEAAEKPLIFLGNDEVFIGACVLV
jgi:hypothetical protein